MAQVVERLAATAEVGLEAIVVMVVVIGLVEALSRLAWQVMMRANMRSLLREVWLRYATWLLLALEFTLAADLVSTIVSPSWDSIGQLAAIGALRTTISYFLGRDIAEFLQLDRENAQGVARQTMAADDGR